MKIWKPLPLSLLVLASLLIYPQPFCIGCEPIGAAHWGHVPSRSDILVLIFSSILAPAIAGFTRKPKSPFVPLMSCVAMVCSQLAGGVSFDSFFGNEGLFILLFLGPFVFTIYATSFALNDISPESYALNLAAERLNLFVKSITFNGVDIRASGLDLRNGGTGQVSIVLSPKVASLNGRVQLADGAEPGTILAYQQPYDPKGPSSKILRVSVQTDGSFTISNLAPGAYKLFAVEEVNSKLMNDAEWQAAQASEAVTVELGESATKSVSIRQIRR